MTTTNYTPATGTLTGPRSFKATLNRREVTERYYPHDVIVEAATFTFDASDAVTKVEQHALFADYTKTAKELGLVARKEAPPHGYSNLPNFKAAAFTASERKLLGKSVGFRPTSAHLFAPVAGGVSVHGTDIIHGIVWSLSPYPKCFWVHVAGQGFYSLREADLLTGVNA